MTKTPKIRLHLTEPVIDRIIYKLRTNANKDDLAIAEKLNNERLYFHLKAIKGDTK